MTAPPYLTRHELAVAEKVLGAVGAYRAHSDPLQWMVPPEPTAWRCVDLREVFPSPWTVPQAGEADDDCTCLVDHVCDPNAEPRCPVHGEAS